MLAIERAVGATLSNRKALLVVGSAFSQAGQHSVDALGEGALSGRLHTQAAAGCVCGLASLGVYSKHLAQTQVIGVKLALLISSLIRFASWALHGFRGFLEVSLKG